MRVSQIQNLTWAGNVLVFAGLVWVGIRFAEVIRGPKTSKELVWEKVKASGEDPAKRWPGDLKDFQPIWTTQVNGKFPPPPPPPGPPPKPPDPAEQFKAKLTYLGGWESPDHPELSTARVKFDRDVSIRPGASLYMSPHRFQLLSFRVIDKPGGVKVGRLVFKNPQTGLPIEIEQAPPQGQSLGAPPGPFPEKKFEGATQINVPERGPLDEGMSYLNPETGEWVVPEQEQRWLEVWGEKKVWSNVSLKPEVDASGTAHGLKVMSPLEGNDAPIAPNHGIAVGDVIRSINGVPVASKEDVIRYLRGDGKGLKRYVVVVDTNGSERKIVYNVPRSRD